MIRAFFLGLIAAWLVLAATAEETINRFDVQIDVGVDGDIEVTETIIVEVEGREIRRGIFRELPRFMMDDEVKMPVNYTVREVRRDGEPEPYETATDGNALRVRIGRPNVMLEHGPHTYEIRYTVKNQVRYFETHDELYWNATGNYWAFPILASKVSVTFPPGAVTEQVAAYTGSSDASRSDYRHSERNGVHTFELMRPLAPREGMTVAVAIEKGVIEPPGLADRLTRDWQRYGSLGILILSLFGVFRFYWRGFNKVGRDPPRLPVFPRYAPPEGYSPAAVHTIYKRSVDAQRAFISTLMYMGVNDQIEIDATSKKSTKLTRTNFSDLEGASKEDRELLEALFKGASVKEFGGKTDTGFTRTLLRYTTKLGKAYGEKYFRWNVFYPIAASMFSFGAVAVAAVVSTDWGLWHTLLVLALAALNFLFMYLMPAPTVIGEQVRSEIAGFKLYLETAEKLQMNAVEVGSDAPPPMSTELYQRFLPYAVALNVEKPWTKYFERVLPTEASNYDPSWSRGNWRTGNTSGMTDSMISNMGSGVSSAMPQSSGSSGSGGGGFSGGGGGGGGGGGW